MSVQPARRRRRNAGRASLQVAAALALALAGLVAASPAHVVGSEPAALVPRTFEITASRYAFDPARVEVGQGDRVRLVLRSADTTHGLEVDGYGIEVVIPKGGEDVSVEFIAHRAGVFRMKCSEYCGTGHRRMQGRFVVAEAGG